MADIRAEQVKELRQRTGAGIMDVKRALQEAGGDVERAVDLLRQRGAAEAARLVSREAREGLIHAYVHHNGRVGVLLELNCQTDFVARTEEFRNLARELGLQIASRAPLAVSPEEVAPDVVERERAIYEAQAREEGKPAAVIPKIVEGKLKKFFEEQTLLEQPYVRDPERRVRELIEEVQARLGERIVVGRFARFEIGR
ncbi:MAG: translation elongation factor Ts [Gemmatimonadetes bacterium]|nr:translation elongation factor Ts [Gemmatimonadota bacterium]